MYIDFMSRYFIRERSKHKGILLSYQGFGVQILEFKPILYSTMTINIKWKGYVYV